MTGRRQHEAMAKRTGPPGTEKAPGVSVGLMGSHHLFLSPQKIVATWEAISLGRQPVPEYFNFAHDVLGV